MSVCISKTGRSADIAFCVDAFDADSFACVSVLSIHTLPMGTVYECTDTVGLLAARDVPTEKSTLTHTARQIDKHFFNFYRMQAMHRIDHREKLDHPPNNWFMPYVHMGYYSASECANENFIYSHIFVIGENGRI